MSGDRIAHGEEAQWIVPGWPAPDSVRAASTLRVGGVSSAPYGTLNLGDHVGDDAAAVATNRRYLQRQLQLPSTPRWLKQVHGTRCVDAAETAGSCAADASFTTREGVVCCVMTADCLPLLLCDKSGDAVAVIHAGWRGLVAGVIEQTITALGRSGELLAWLGPAIGPQQFEVGPEVRAAFVARDAAATTAFAAGDGNRWLADIYTLARLALEKQGVKEIYGGQWCTVSDAERFYSYRRDGVTGRMATLIWIAP